MAMLKSIILVKQQDQSPKSQMNSTLSKQALVLKKRVKLHTSRITYDR